MFVFKITADYRPKNPKKPTYLVSAMSAKEAREWFSRRAPWLKVYKVEKTDLSAPETQTFV